MDLCPRGVQMSTPHQPFQYDPIRLARGFALMDDAAKLELRAPVLEEKVIDAIAGLYGSLEHRPSFEAVRTAVRDAFRDALKKETD